MENSERSWWQDSTLVVAGGTLYLYILVVAFVDGYLWVFRAESSWFSPSLFQLISFSHFGLLLSVGIIFGFYWLLFNCPNSKARHYRFMAIAYAVVVNFIGAYCFQIWLRSPLSPPLAITLLGYALVIVFGLGALLPLREWEIADKLFGGFVTLLQTDKTVFELTTRLVFASLIGLVGFIFLPQFCDYLGRTYAYLVVTRTMERATLLLDVAPPQNHVLFTDGERTITWEVDAGSYAVYNNAATGKSTILRSMPKLPGTVVTQPKMVPTSNTSP